MRYVWMAKIPAKEADAMAGVIWTTCALTLCIQKGNPLTVLVRKGDAMAHLVCMTFVMTLCIQKKVALTFCMCKIWAAFSRQIL